VRRLGVFCFCARGFAAGAGFVRIFADDAPVAFPAALGVSTVFRDRDAVDCAGADLRDSCEDVLFFAITCQRLREMSKP
jgi:hypothetical protein